MALESLDNGEQLMDGSPNELFPVETALKHYTAKIFFTELEMDDEIIIRIFDLDKFAVVEKQNRKVIIRGIQESETIVNWIPSGGFRITCEQISQGVGGFKTITWELLSS